MMKITGLSHLFKWENLHNWWLTKYFFAPLSIYRVSDLSCNLKSLQITRFTARMANGGELYTTPALHMVILGLCAVMETHFMKLLLNSSSADVASRGSLELCSEYCN